MRTLPNNVVGPNVVDGIRDATSISRVKRGSADEMLPADKIGHGDTLLQAQEASPKTFRFFDNRQKYLLFVNTCSEKRIVARRVSLELANIIRGRRRFACSTQVWVTEPF